jgi:hypothetical protein
MKHLITYIKESETPCVGDIWTDCAHQDWKIVGTMLANEDPSDFEAFIYRFDSTELRDKFGDDEDIQDNIIKAGYDLLIAAQRVGSKDKPRVFAFDTKW